MGLPAGSLTFTITLDLPNLNSSFFCSPLPRVKSSLVWSARVVASFTRTRYWPGSAANTAGSTPAVPHLSL